MYIAHPRCSSIAERGLAGQFARPAQRVLGSLDEVGEFVPSPALLSLESGEALLPSFAELGRPSQLFIGPVRSTLR
ncbi:MAG TPA: hypothetical protein VKB92_11810, partial [Myxococcales bacterium]|nr:hypothetical protein [Myxococcales bacterium]